MTKDEIWRAALSVEKACALKQRELMAEYDQTVYRPQLEILCAKCAKLWHRRGNTHYNGLRWTFVYCADCGECIECIGPDG